MIYFNFVLSQLKLWDILKGVPLFHSVLFGQYIPPKDIEPFTIHEQLEFLIKKLF